MRLNNAVSNPRYMNNVTNIVHANFTSNWTNLTQNLNNTRLNKNFTNVVVTNYFRHKHAHKHTWVYLSVGVPLVLCAICVIIRCVAIRNSNRPKASEYEGLPLIRIEMGPR